MLLCWGLNTCAALAGLQLRAGEGVDGTPELLIFLLCLPYRVSGYGSPLAELFPLPHYSGQVYWDISIEKHYNNPAA